MNPVVSLLEESLEVSLNLGCGNHFLDAGGSAWIKPAHPRFFMPGFALSPIFRAKLRDALARAGLAAALDPAVWNRRWVVHAQSIGRGEHAALYLSRYVYAFPSLRSGKGAPSAQLHDRPWG